MRRYPQIVATKQDFQHLLVMPEHRERALAELQAIHDLQDDTLTIDETPADAAPDAERVLRVADNPLPAWLRVGFESREAVQTLMSTVP